MKTIIDSKQAERLKEVCEKHGVKLLRTDHIGIPAPDDNVLIVYDTDHLIDGIAILSLTDLLDWLPDSISTIPNIWLACISFGYNKDQQSGYYACYSGYDNKEEEMDHIPNNWHYQNYIDALFELFIWTIESGYYKGVE